MSTRRLFLSAHNTSEFETLPRFAVVESPNITILLDLLPTLSNLCKWYQLTEVRRNFDVTFEDEDDLGLNNYELVVNKTHFWFEAQAKHDDSHVETWLQPIADFQALCADNPTGNMTMGEVEDDDWADLIAEYDEDNQ